MTGAKITAIGTYVPAKRLTNADLEQIVDTNNEWIVQRTGIRERRISRQDEYTSDLCAAAVQDLMTRYGKSVQDVDMVLVATSTPDFSFPSVASLIQNRFNIPQTAGAMDLSAACAGLSMHCILLTVMWLQECIARYWLLVRIRSPRLRIILTAVHVFFLGMERELYLWKVMSSRRDF